VGDEAMTKAYIQKSMDSGKELHASYSLLGRVFLEKFFTDTSAGRTAFVDSAQQYFRKALKLNPEHGEAYLGLGEIAFQQQLYKEAIKNFEKCVQYAPENVDGYLYLAQCYKMMANQSKNTEGKYLNLAIENYEQGNSMTPNNPIIMANLGFLYFRIGNCDKAIPYFEMVQDYPGLSPQERQSIKDCMAKCR
jgi:tetratricopeptide (TPR) repeat protein